MTSTGHRRLAVPILALFLFASCSSSSDSDSLRTSDDGVTRVTIGDRPERPDGEPTASTETPVGGPSDGCESTQVGAITQARFSLDGAGDLSPLDDDDEPDNTRTLLLTVPEDHDGDTPVPLVVALHGLAEDADTFAAVSELDSLAADHGVAVVFPEGTGEPPRWDARPGDENFDVTFIDRLLDGLETELCIDRSRIYVAGFSNGALLASLLACRLADRVTAVAAVSGVRAPQPCEQERSVPMLAMHGTADPILGFNGGVGNIPDIWESEDLDTETYNVDGPGFPSAVATWAERSRCLTNPVDRSSEASITRSYDCPPKSAVTFVIIIDGGHTWPGSAVELDPDVVGATAEAPDATEEIWSFFDQHSLDG